jgi:hypothetical protein
VPEQFATAFAQGGTGALNEIGGVGDLGASILAQVPEQFRAQVEPLIPGIVSGIHEAFSLATAATFTIGIVTALIAAFVVLVVMPAGRIGFRAGDPVSTAAESEAGPVPVGGES